MISRHRDGVLVEVWVVPGASRDEVLGEHDGALKVRTSAPASQGRANRRAGALVAEAIGGRRGTVVTGESARRKTVLVEGVDRASALATLASRVSADSKPPDTS